MQLESQIREVTVYTDRALVARRASVTLQPGVHHLRLIGLTAQLEEDSLRVRADGDAEAILHGFDLREHYVSHASSEELAAQEAMAQALRDEARALDDAEAIQKGQLDTLRQTATQLSGSFAHQLAEGRLKLEDWQDALAFVEARQAAVSARLLDIARQKRAVAERQAALEAALARQQSLRGDSGYEAVVTIEVLQAGSLTLTLEYVVWGASWEPAYDARLSQEGDRLEWRYYGLVRQTSGENWDEVALRLSTARPAESSEPPELPDWTLAVRRPEPAPMLMRNEYDMPPPAPSAAPAPSMRERRVEVPQAAVAEQGTSVTMAVARPLTIPSDGAAHQAPIGQLELPPALRYRVVPKVQPHVYLEVEIDYTGPWPLLCGPVKAFVGQDYVGTVPLDDEVMPGQRFALPMGVDRALQVERKRLKKHLGDAGLLKKDRFAEYRYEVQLTSYKATPQQVVVIEPVPRSLQDDIRVKLGEMSATAAQDEPGQLRWEVQLVPREPQKLTWGYRVEYPGSLEVAGLE